MDQQISNELPPLHQPEQQPQKAIETVGAGAQSEVETTRAVEKGQSQAQPLPVPQMPTIPGITPSATSVAPQASNTPAIADDTDLIEKEWVLKAKEIVARTKHDPYQQNKEVEQIKADYLKKRYNKDIKVAE